MIKCIECHSKNVSLTMIPSKDKSYLGKLASYMCNECGGIAFNDHSERWRRIASALEIHNYENIKEEEL